MKSFLVLFSLCCFLAASAVEVNSAIPPSRVEMVIDEDFDLPGGPGNAHRSIPLAIPFSVFLNDNHSIDLMFYLSVGEVEIVISQNGNIVYSFTGNGTSGVLNVILLPHDLWGDCLLEIKGKNGGYAYGWFSLNN